MYEFPSSGKKKIVIDKEYAAGQMGENWELGIRN
jgi:hypothetical protein